MTVAAGNVLTESLLVDVAPVNLTGVKLSSEGCVLQARSSPAPGVALNCPHFAAGTPIKSEPVDATLVLQGSLLAVGSLAGARLVDAALVPSGGCLSGERGVQRGAVWRAHVPSAAWACVWGVLFCALGAAGAGMVA